MNKRLIHAEDIYIDVHTTGRMTNLQKGDILYAENNERNGNRHEDHEYFHNRI